RLAPAPLLRLSATTAVAPAAERRPPAEPARWPSAEPVVVGRVPAGPQDVGSLHQRTRASFLAAGLTESMVQDVRADMVWTDPSGRSYSASEVRAAFPDGPSSFPASMFPMTLTMKFVAAATTASHPAEPLSEDKVGTSVPRHTMSKRFWAMIWWSVVFVPMVGPALIYAQLRRLASRLAGALSRAAPRRARRAVASVLVTFRTHRERPRPPAP
ncbi:unnamed protein product, partial [Prorocentrum cordatum]